MAHRRSGEHPPAASSAPSPAPQRRAAAGRARALAPGACSLRVALKRVKMQCREYNVTTIQGASARWHELAWRGTGGGGHGGSRRSGSDGDGGGDRGGAGGGGGGVPACGACDGTASKRVMRASRSVAQRRPECACHIPSPFTAHAVYTSTRRLLQASTRASDASQTAAASASSRERSLGSAGAQSTK